MTVNIHHLLNYQKPRTAPQEAAQATQIVGTPPPPPATWQTPRCFQWQSSNGHPLDLWWSLGPQILAQTSAAVGPRTQPMSLERPGPGPQYGLSWLHRLLIAACSSPQLSLWFYILHSVQTAWLHFLISPLQLHLSHVSITIHPSWWQLWQLLESLSWGALVFVV